MAGRDWIWRPARLSRNGQRSFKQPPRQQVAIFPICTPDAQGMRRGLLGQWLATPRPVRREERGARTPPERHWSGGMCRRRRATLPVKGAWERQIRRNDSGVFQRRKVLVHESRGGIFGGGPRPGSRKKGGALPGGP